MPAALEGLFCPLSLSRGRCGGLLRSPVVKKRSVRGIVFGFFWYVDRGHCEDFATSRSWICTSGLTEGPWSPLKKIQVPGQTLYRASSLVTSLELTEMEACGARETSTHQAWSQSQAVPWPAALSQVARIHSTISTFEVLYNSI